MANFDLLLVQLSWLAQTRHEAEAWPDTAWLSLAGLAWLASLTGTWPGLTHRPGWPGYGLALAWHRPELPALQPGKSDTSTGRRPEPGTYGTSVSA
ncbi:hypothetical protein AVEN_98082-1 [Araneus ventricosus]|uniref:Uncharacterized protein n=1 Tax=Araneus ventricosus TaxID=182803 RepID=A0A4Y2VEZ7_ARAVE|nr:hypothetical protein AVEN_98082-1 [Araneus ventricosus]